MGTHPIFESDFDCLTDMRSRDVRILDSLSRKKRNERWVSSLHKDNHASEKGETLEKMFEMLEKEREKRIKVRKDKQDNGILHKRIEKKSKKTIDVLMEEEEIRLKRTQKDENDKISSYKSIQAPKPIRPPRKLCCVCGEIGKYNCVVCGASYCRIICKNTHEETRCLKWN